MESSQLDTRPVGAGPLQLEQITATRAELAPNPRYIDPPHLQGLTLPLLSRPPEPDVRLRPR